MYKRRSDIIIIEQISSLIGSLWEFINNTRWKCGMKKGVCNDIRSRMISHRLYSRHRGYQTRSTYCNIYVITS